MTCLTHIHTHMYTRTYAQAHISRYMDIHVKTQHTLVITYVHRYTSTCLGFKTEVHAPHAGMCTGKCAHNCTSIHTHTHEHGELFQLSRPQLTLLLPPHMDSGLPSPSAGHITSHAITRQDIQVLVSPHML